MSRETEKSPLVRHLIQYAAIVLGSFIYALGFQLFMLPNNIVAGGVTGVGLGRSIQKALYLPEPMNDFITAIIGEELGFVGLIVMLLAFLLLIWRCCRIALRAKDYYGMLLASGILLLLAGGAALLVSFQRRRRLEAENQLLQAKLQLDRQQSRLSTLQDSAATPALTLALRSYEQLCSRYEPDGDNAALLREFRQQMADLRNGTAFAADLETTLEAACPGLPQRIREIPGLREDDRRLLQYLAAGFPTGLKTAPLKVTVPLYALFMPSACQYMAKASASRRGLLAP